MNIEISREALKDLRDIDEPMRSRIREAIQRLSHEPPLGDMRAMSSRDGYRLRVGNYRVLFDILDNKILVHAIGHRSGIYK